MRITRLCNWINFSFNRGIFISLRIWWGRQIYALLIPGWTCTQIEWRWRVNFGSPGFCWNGCEIRQANNIVIFHPDYCRKLWRFAGRRKHCSYRPPSSFFLFYYWADGVFLPTTEKYFLHITIPLCRDDAAPDSSTTKKFKNQVSDLLLRGLDWKLNSRIRFLITILAWFYYFSCNLFLNSNSKLFSWWFETFSKNLLDL